jgi:hypothetical protein
MSKKQEEKRKCWTSRALLQQLQSDDIKVAANAGRILAQRRAIPDLLKTFKTKNHTLRRRALSVLYAIEWRKVGSRLKTKTCKTIFPNLLLFDQSGRTMESHLCQEIMLKIGSEAMPAFLALVKSRHSILQVMGLTALKEVRWSRISPKAALKVRDELVKIKDREGPIMFRFMAREVIKSISRTYSWCIRAPGGVRFQVASVRGPGFREPGDREQRTQFGGGFV